MEQFPLPTTCCTFRPYFDKNKDAALAVFPPKINSRVGEIYKLLCFKFHTMKICSIKIKFLIYNKKKGWCSATLPPFGGNTGISDHIFLDPHGTCFFHTSFFSLAQATKLLLIFAVATLSTIWFDTPITLRTSPFYKKNH